MLRLYLILNFYDKTLDVTLAKISTYTIYINQYMYRKNNCFQSGWWENW